MQDKSYVVAIVIVLGICCLGMYVAVTGFLNNNPIVFATPTALLVQATPFLITLPTSTIAPAQPVTVKPIAPTTAPLPSPQGAFQTITTAATIALPTVAPRTSAATVLPTQASALSCTGFQFCWKAGPADIALGPGGQECPRNYIWGLVLDANGKGMPGIKVRHRAPNGDVGETTTKDRPDVPGKYDVLSPSGTFTIWLALVPAARKSVRKFRFRFKRTQAPAIVRCASILCNNDDAALKQSSSNNGISTCPGGNVAVVKCSTVMPGSLRSK